MICTTSLFLYTSTGLMMIHDESKHAVILQKQGQSFVINIAAFNALIITILLSQVTQWAYSMKNDFSRHKLKNSAS